MRASIWSFAWHRQRSVILCAVTAVVITTLWVRPWHQQPAIGWWQCMDAICGVATLAVALIVWWGELTENWEHQLPKLLRVEFRFEGHPVMVCEDAPLITENDIRAMAQQIGKQMNDGNELKLRPTFVPRPPFVDRRASGGPIRRYEIHMCLKELPESLIAIRESQPHAFIEWRVVDGIEQPSIGGI